MRIAVIDLGTNTFHLMLADVSEVGYNIFLKDRIPVKIGEKGINKNEITPAAQKRALEALADFNQTIKENSVEKVFGTATSAIRNAKNGKELVANIHRLTGIKIEIISGLREAELIQLGASMAMDLGTEKNLIMDIGGGSVEFIIADKEQTYWMQSFEIGGQRMVERFHKSDPITATEVDNLHQFFAAELKPLFHACLQYQPTTLVGCSGTFDTLSDIYMLSEGQENDAHASEYPLPTEAFYQLLAELRKKSRSERLAIPGMIEMRVDMIVVASVFVAYILEKVTIDRIRVSAYALKEGILFNALKKIQNPKD
ncbi:MAG: exopolyphosphatase [Bacteroidota bacterium]